MIAGILILVRALLFLGRAALLVEYQELAHEVEVGLDDGSRALDYVVGAAQVDVQVVHDVGDCDGRTSGQTCLAVHEHVAASLSCFF